MFEFTKLTSELLSAIENWFKDSETVKYIGGLDWINKSLERPALAVGKEFKGAKVLDRVPLVVFDQTTPIGFIELEIYSKNIFDEKSSELHATGTFVYITDPAKRRQGLGTKLLSEFLELPQFMYVKTFIATTDLGNLASEKSLEKVGFKKTNDLPDEDGSSTWTYSRK